MGALQFDTAAAAVVDGDGNTNVLLFYVRCDDVMHFAYYVFAKSSQQPNNSGVVVYTVRTIN